MTRRTFRAMGTDIDLLVQGGQAHSELAAAEAEFHRLERLLTRFDPSSELSQLNEKGSLAGGPDLLEVVRLALAGRSETAGRFDPTVHDAVVESGYDRTFDELPDDGPAPAAGTACGGAVRIAGNLIELDDGVRLDLGGIGKGYAAEKAATILSAAGPCLVNAGGDIALRGKPWTIAVQPELTLELLRRRPGDLGSRPTRLAAWRQRASSHHRPCHGRACRMRPAARDRRSPGRGPGRDLGEGALPRRFARRRGRGRLAATSLRARDPQR